MDLLYITSHNPFVSERSYKRGFARMLGRLAERGLNIGIACLNAEMVEDGDSMPGSLDIEIRRINNTLAGYVRLFASRHPRIVVADWLTLSFPACMACVIHNLVSRKRAKFVHYQHVVPLELTWRSKLAYQICCKYAWRTVCVSDHSALAMKEFAHPNNVYTIRNGWSPADLRPLVSRDELRRRHNIDPDALMVCNVGHMHRWKGQVFLAKSFSRIAHNYRQARLVIVGNVDDPAIRSEVEKIAMQDGWIDRLRVMGFQHGLDWIGASDLCVISSLTESFPTVMVEAIANRVPLIATACGGPDEFLTDGENALLVPVGDQDAMSQALSALAGDRQLREKLSDNAVSLLSSVDLDVLTNQWKALILDAVHPSQS